MWIQIKTNCRSKWYPTLTAGQQIDLDYDSAKLLIAEGLAFEIPPQPVASAGGISLQKYRANLTSAHILALNSSPQIILPAPPSGKLWIPTLFLVKVYPGSTQYDLTGVTRITIFGTEIVVSLPSTTFVGDNLFNALASAGGTCAVALLPSFFNLAEGEQSTSDSEFPLVGGGDPQPLKLETEGANPATGNGTISVTTYYIEDDLT